MNASYVLQKIEEFHGEGYSRLGALKYAAKEKVKKIGKIGVGGLALYGAHKYGLEHGHYASLQRAADAYADTLNAHATLQAIRSGHR